MGWEQTDPGRAGGGGGVKKKRSAEDNMQTMLRSARGERLQTEREAGLQARRNTRRGPDPYGDPQKHTKHKPPARQKSHRKELTGTWSMFDMFFLKLWS